MMKIGIWGLGFVGGSVKHWFEKESPHELYLYDKYKNIGSEDEVNKADVIFIAVPTPFNEGTGYDDSAVQSSIRGVADGKIIVIKSTVMPLSTDKFQRAYPNKTILFNPEFLRQNTAQHDFIHPKRQLVGYASLKGKEVSERIMALLPRAPFMAVMKASEAELVKYFSNTFLAARVVFANQLFDICQAAGVDYDVVKNVASQDPRIGHSHFDVFDEGYRGYSGACLPKDTRALIQFAKVLGVGTDLLDSFERINNRLLKQSTQK